MTDSANLYVALANELEQALARGTVPPGGRLPSIRQMSQTRGLSRNTVVAAYRLLEDRCLIEARPQSGYFARLALDLPSLEPVATAMAGSAPDSSVLDLIGAVLYAQQTPGFTDLGLACPRGSEFYPQARLARITSQLLRHQPEIISSYALPPGSPRLRTQIARRGLALGMSLDPESIILTHGCMEAIQLALRAVTRPGDTVGLETPTYFSLLPLLTSLGLSVIEIPTDPVRGLSVDAVEALLGAGALNAIVAMPTVHNPLGATMPLEAKQRLAALVNRYQVPLIEDALYAELQFSPILSPTVKSFDQGGWVIVCASYTKTLAPDFRLGWTEGGRFGEAIKRLKFSSSISESVILSESVGILLESGGYDHHLRTLRHRYAIQMAQVRTMVARYFPEGTRSTAPGGGFLLWVELPSQVDCVELFHRAIAEKISLIPGPLNSASGRYRHALRLSCCYPMDARYQAALARIGQLAGQMMDQAPQERLAPAV
jgi:DNA-binding transcriptional MocR family regulator